MTAATRRIALAAAVLVAAAVVVLTVVSSLTGQAGTSEFRGVNWADPRDNYTSDEVVPSGLSMQDDYRTTYRIASAVVGEFRHELAANTVRLPVNPASVGTDWWESYRGAIDAATDQGFRVILSYWEADAAKDGRVDDPAAFDAMWDTVVDAYEPNPRVYFEPMNEPFGYSLDDWVGLTSSWLDRHDDVPRSRVIVSGTGYNDDVTGVGAAKELEGTLLSLHFYGFWADHTTEQEWLDNLLPRIGEHGSRTIVSEAGAPMTVGLNYGNHEGDVSTAYLGALTQTVREQHMGIVYWPGLRTGDSYSLTEFVDDGDLEVTSTSGLAQLQWGWGLLKEEQLNDLPPAPAGAEIRSVAADRCLDVPGFSTAAGTALDLWDCNGGGNQSWDVTAERELTVYGDMCLSVGGVEAGPGSPAIITDCTGAADQAWDLNEDHSITNVARPELCLSLAGTGNGTPVEASTCTGEPNQQWTRP